MEVGYRPMEPVYETIGRNIQRFRLKQGLSQGALARRARLTQPMVFRYEVAESRLSVHALVAISSALGVEVTDLLRKD